MDKTKVAYEAMLGLCAEIVLDEAILSYQTKLLRAGIDEALAAGDEDKFHRLAKQLNDLRN